MKMICFCGRTYSGVRPICTNKECRAFGQSLPHTTSRPQG